MPAGDLMQANDVGECRSTVPHAACVENVRSGHEADRSRASEVVQLVAKSVSTNCRSRTTRYADIIPSVLHPPQTVLALASVGSLTVPAIGPWSLRCINQITELLEGCL